MSPDRQTRRVTAVQVNQRTEGPGRPDRRMEQDNHDFGNSGNKNGGLSHATRNNSGSHHSDQDTCSSAMSPVEQERSGKDNKFQKDQRRSGASCVIQIGEKPCENTDNSVTMVEDNTDQSATPDASTASRNTHISKRHHQQDTSTSRSQLKYTESNPGLLPNGTVPNGSAIYSPKHSLTDIDA